jgi:hypothetical protein
MSIKLLLEKTMEKLNEKETASLGAKVEMVTNLVVHLQSPLFELLLLDFPD